MKFLIGQFRIYGRALTLLWSVSPTLVKLQLFLQVILALLPLGVLYTTQGLFDSFIKANDPPLSQPYWVWLLALGSIQLVQVIVAQVNGYFSGLFTQNLSDFTSKRILEKSIAIPFPYFEDAAYHDSLHLAQKQSIYKLPLLFSQIQTVCSNGLSLLLLLGYFFSVLSSYAWMILVFALPVAIIKWYSGFALHQMEKRQVTKEREANYLHSILTGENFALEVRTLNYGKRLIEKFQLLRNSIFVEKKKLSQRLTGYGVIAESVELVVLLYILLQLSQGAILGVFSWSLLVVYIQGVQKLQANLKGFLTSVVSLIQQRIFLGDLFKFFDIPMPSNSDSVHNFIPDGPFDLELKQVSFRYPGNSQLALDQVSLKLPQGKIIGIVGANGSGKSTLVKLLSGLYQPTEGQILLNGVSQSQVETAEWRSKTLFLFQDFQKYFFSIQEMVSLGPEVPYTSPEQIQEALRQAEAWDFVSRLDSGIQSKLGRAFREGNGLSGGQWQKLAVSRAFFRNPKLLVLDEPTSGIDALAETSIFQNLKEKATERITVLITHRLYNLKDADYIYVLEQGKVVEEGDFEELAKQNGVFAQLYIQQKFG